MAKEQKQVCDIRAGKRMTVAQSNEHLRIGDKSAWNAKIAGTLDPTRTHLNFEIGKGGVVKDVDKTISIPRRIKKIFEERGIDDPNRGLTDDDLNKSKVGVRTHANIILEGSRETMRQLAFGDQKVNYERGADNSQVKRSEGIEKWALDMYRFFARKYGEENIAAFVVHLDETNPHIHCTLLPITEKNELSWVKMFSGKNKYEYSEKMKKLHSELAEVNEKYGLKRGDDIRATGAKHKSYVEWLKEQEKTKEDNIKKQDITISRQATVITQQNKQITALDAEIKKAETRLKGLQTMINNLEEQKARVSAEIVALEELYERGEISNNEMERRKAQFTSEIAEIETKILDKQTKLEKAEKQLRDLAFKQAATEKEYDELQRKINTDMPKLAQKTMRDMSAIGYDAVASQSQQRMHALDEYSKTLSPEEKKVFEKVHDVFFGNSLLEDMAQRSDEIVAVATALFLGYVDQASAYAESHGGGGGPGGGWGRKKDEDDEAFKRRCFIMGSMMMKPAGRKLKRS